ncbi:MAG: cyclic nucleotide-binding domain-containing protein [Thermodesulfobacteriota bacterium]
MIESKYLKDSVQNIQKLMTIPPLRKFETKYLGQLIRLSKIREYESGELIIKEGGQDTWIYFLLSGKVRVEKKGMEIAIIDKIGEIFGEMRLLDGLARSASVYAEGKTVCLAFDPYGADSLSSPDQRTKFLLLLYKMFAEFLSSRLRIINDELSQIKKETGKK